MSKIIMYIVLINNREIFEFLIYLLYPLKYFLTIKTFY